MKSDYGSYEYSTFSTLIFGFLHGLGKFALFILSLGVLVLLPVGIQTLLGTNAKSDNGIILGCGIVQLIFVVVQYSLLSKVLEDFDARKKPISELLLRVTFASIGMIFIAFGGCAFMLINVKL